MPSYILSPSLPLSNCHYILPIYKGKKDPLDPNSYRGIFLPSTISKVLEIIVLRGLLQVDSSNGAGNPFNASKDSLIKALLLS